MLVVDTDVVVRHLTNDDEAQAARARRLIERHDVFLPLTVLLEAEWVLRCVYAFQRRMLSGRCAVSPGCRE